MENLALLRSSKMSNLAQSAMAERKPPVSEAEELDSFLADLESMDKVKEIAGWESGFPNLSRALNGILPGLYLLIGPPSCGKTAFAKQLCDQVVQHNLVPTIFFTFAETKKELRIRTLSRLSGLEGREIRRGSSFILHWYGVPKARFSDPEQIAPSWEKLKRAAEQAKSWLDLIYLFEANEKTNLKEIENHIRRVKETKGTDRVMVVIDDSQYLGASDWPIDSRLSLITEQLQRMAVNLDVPVLATWPDLKRESHHTTNPQEWAMRIPSAEVVLVMEDDPERTKKLTEPSRAVTLHIVKNRGGERGKLYFDFFPSLAKFAEVNSDREA